MKYVLVLKLSILLFFILIQIVTPFKTKSRSKMKSKSRSKAKSKKTVVKVKSTKKDGPLNWETMNEDPVLEGLLRQERMHMYNSGVMNSNSRKYSDTGLINNNHYSNRPILSENQKSKTFRTVSPFEDSTKTNTGKKYSQIFRSYSNKKNIHPGYYGKSRLTRL